MISSFGAIAPLQVVVLHAPADSGFRDELLKRLRPHREAVHIWHPDSIEAGDSVDEAALRAMNAANLVVALLSADFFADDPCNERLAHAMTLRDRGLHIIPVLVRSVTIHDDALAGLQMLPRDRVPIAGREGHDQEIEWTKVAAAVTAYCPSFGPPKDEMELFQEVLRFCRLDYEAGGARVELVETMVGRPLWQVAEVLAVKPGKSKAALLIAAVKGTPTEEHLTALRPMSKMHFQRHRFSAFTQLVYDGPPPSDELAHASDADGIVMVGLAEHQRLIDMDPYVERLLSKLERDPLYPPSLYVPQRGMSLHSDAPPTSDVLAKLEAILLTADQRFIVVLGDFGTGKTFLLKRLAARLGARRKPPYPVLIEMRALEKVHSVDALAAQHFAAEGRPFFPEAFRAMLRAGQIVLLFDGFDELALRVRYARAAEHLDMLTAAAEGKAKVVLTSRTQHFASDQQVRTALAERADRVTGREILKLLAFDQSQIKQFIQNRLQDEVQASARVKLLDDVKDLLGLSANPRMLSFIAGLPEPELLKARDRNQEITAASLYRRLLDYWFVQEDERLRLHNPTDKLLPQERWEAVELLALCLWGRTERLMDIRELPAEVGRVIGDLSVRDLDKDIVAHQVGTATLLVREGEGRFSFLHQSVMEWLVANTAARVLKVGGRPDVLEKGEMSPLMVDFFTDLAPVGKAVEWAKDVLQGNAGDAAKRNAMVVLRRAGARVERANYRGKDLRGQDFSSQDLTNADFTGADLSEAQLVGANLTDAILRDATLKDANFDKAILVGADLTGADLARARLLGSNLTGARLTGATLYRAKAAGAKLDRSALTQVRDRYGACALHAGKFEVMHDTAGSICRTVGMWRDVVAAGYEDGTIRIWDRSAGKLLRTLSAHTGRVWSVAFSPDGKTLASGSGDNSVRVWDVCSGALLHSMAGHSGWVRCVAFSPDGKTLASGSADNSVRLWDCSSGTLVRSLEGHSDGVLSIAISPDGRTVASGSADKSIRLWDAVAGTMRHAFHGHSLWVTSVAFSLDGTTLASGSDDNSIRLWDLPSAALSRALKGHTAAVTSIAFSPDGTTLASSSFDTSIVIWNQSSGSQLRSLVGHSAPVLSLTFGPDGTTLASASSDGSVRIWNPFEETSLLCLEGQATFGRGRQVLQAVFSLNGEAAALCSTSGTARIWDPPLGKVALSLDATFDDTLKMALSPSGKILATAKAPDVAPVSMGDWVIAEVSPTGAFSRDDKFEAQLSASDKLISDTHSLTTPIKLWERATGKIIRVLEVPGRGVRAITFNTEGTLLASVSGSAICLWSAASGDLIRTIEGRFLNASFGQNGAVIACVSSDKVSIFEVASGRQLRTLEDPRTSALHKTEAALHEFRAYQSYTMFKVAPIAAFSPNGAILAAGNTKDINLWSPASGGLIRTLEGPYGAVSVMGFSPDGRSLGCAYSEKTIHIWKVSTGELTAVLEGATGNILALHWYGTGRFVAAACVDGTIHVWNVADRRRVALMYATEIGWVSYRSDGRYKLSGDLRGAFWHIVGLCRFELGELDAYIPGLRMTDDEPIIEDFE
jgi:WD40 repeat protein